MTDSASEESYLPVRAAALESGLSERTIYDKAAKGTIRQRRNEEGQIEVDVSQLGPLPGTAPFDSTRSVESPLVDPVARERAHLAALRLQREREEFEAQVRRERREAELHEERLEHERLLAEQTRQYEQARAIQERSLREESLRLKGERERRLRTLEQNAAVREEDERAKREAEALAGKLADMHFDAECGKLERLLVSVVAIRRGFDDSQRIRAVIRQLAEAYRSTRDFESLQFTAVLALREL